MKPAYAVAPGQNSLEIRPMDNYVDGTSYVPVQARPPKVIKRTYASISPEREEIKAWVLNRIKEAGFDTQIADRIINCESGWNPNATNLNKNGTRDIGIWQINDVHRLSIEDRRDYKKATEWAIKLMQSKRSYNHWVCYTK